MTHTRMIGLLVAATGLAATFAASARPSAQVETASECRRAVSRAEAARHRAERSLRRSRVAVARVAAELKRAGVSTKLAAAGPGTPSAPAIEGAGVDALVRLDQATWQLKRDTEAVAHAVITEMENRRLRSYPEFFHAPPVPEERGAAERGDRPAECTGWALDAERAAFRAEQWAQLAEVASEQAIALADGVVQRGAPATGGR